MQGQMIIRICATCEKPLTFQPDGTQEGYYCCDEYLCSDRCLTLARHMSVMTWAKDHYDDDGDCYYTGWEAEYITEKEMTL